MTNHLREVVADALLPCPVCIGKGSVDRQHDADGMLWVYVSCNKCGLRTRGKWCSSGNDCPLFYREVRDEWNTRATLPTQSAGVEEQSGKSMYDEYSGNHPTIHCNRFPSWSELTHDQRDEWNRKAATLGRQQGGEQEATCAGCNGRGEVGGWAGDGYQTDPCPFCTPSGLPDALTGDFDCPKAAECRACPCGFCTALRTKQPAASEGDGRVPEAELLALVSGPYMYHHKMNELQEREAKGFDRCRELTMENIRIWCATRRAMFADNTSKQAAGEAVAFQSRVQPWMLECFGAEIAGDMVERGDRFLEESLELLQAHGYDRSRIATLVDYVWGRPIGEPAQEVGGVMVTLAAYCLAAGIDMHEAGETELARILRPEIIEKIRRKQASKNGIHTPLPTPPRHPADEGAVCAEDLRWLDDIAADLKQAGGSTNNMRLIALNRAIAALQAGTP